MHELISRTYDLASLQISKHELMSEVAEFFSARAAVLIAGATASSPDLICCGASRKIAGGDHFIRVLESSLSRAGVDRLVASNLNASLDEHDGRQYTLLFDTDTALIGGLDTSFARAKALLPHIVRSMNVSDWSDRAARAAKRAVGDLSQEITPATLILDETGRIVDINTKASLLLQSCNSIKEVGGRLELSMPSMAGRLKALLRSQLDDPRADPVFLNVNEPGRSESLTLLLKRRENPTRGVIIYIRRLRSTCPVLPAHIIQKFGLSPKEVRLTTGLLQGESLGDLASKFNVSRHTLRAQTKSVFRKTNVRSQAALILLVFDDQLSVFDQ